MLAISLTAFAKPSFWKSSGGFRRLFFVTIACHYSRKRPNAQFLIALFFTCFWLTLNFYKEFQYNWMTTK
jgi:hypothetical protein